MNLMRVFNKNYLLQNLKKSKIVLSIFIGLIPILNTIILIMMQTSVKNKILSFAEISVMNIIGLYILPIIISICLFNYIYKKKSVDFINSMPISRKSIFVTNTILGIIIFTLMLLINIILILGIAWIFNAHIPLVMLFDYFWFFALSFTFTFSATNLAMTISGNAITQIVVTLLLFFLVPFSNAYITSLIDNSTNNTVLLKCTTEACMPEKYYCYDDLECNINKNLNKYEVVLNKITENNYTTPFGLIYESFTNHNRIINTTSVIKMIILTIIYIILGYILFIRRKMEVSETSFKNIHIHNIVKSLTLVPVVALSYLVFRYESSIFIIFLIAIMLVYYFVYDLITKKSITNIRLSLLYFTTTLVLLTTIFSIADRDNEENNIINYNDIKEVAININNYSGRNSNNKIYIANKELISIVILEMLNEPDYSSNLNYITTYLKTKDNTEYKTNIPIDNKKYNEILTLLSEEKDYIESYKNINFDKVYAVKLGNKVYSKEEGSEYIKLIEQSLSKISLKEFFSLQQKYNNVSDEFYITLYTYENHDRKSFAINGYINYDLLNSIVNSNNALLKENMTNVIPDDYSLYYMNSYIEEDYDIDYFVLRSAKNDVYDFILKELGTTIDMKKEYITLEINLDYESYQFTTNNVDEFIKILDKKYQEIKDTEEYKEYNDPYYEKTYIEVYD